MKNICKSSTTYEYRMKDLEVCEVRYCMFNAVLTWDGQSKLSEDLSNFRAVEGLVQESYKALQVSIG